MSQRSLKNSEPYNFRALNNYHKMLGRCDDTGDFTTTTKLRAYKVTHSKAQPKNLRAIVF